MEGEYARYIRLTELLSLQAPAVRSESEAHASEHLFIVVHQASELLLKQMLCDLHSGMAVLQSAHPNWARAEQLVARAGALMTELGRLLGLLRHLPREHFLSFRDGLGGVSASQSTQFAELFALLGTVAQAGPLLKSFWSAADGNGRMPPEARALARGLDSLTSELSAWQRQHLSVATRLIGELPGTGGTTGVAWLEQRYECTATRLLGHR